jgi:hypothetical protein
VSLGRVRGEPVVVSDACGTRNLLGENRDVDDEDVLRTGTPRRSYPLPEVDVYSRRETESGDSVFPTRVPS